MIHIHRASLLPNSRPFVSNPPLVHVHPARPEDIQVRSVSSLLQFLQPEPRCYYSLTLTIHVEERSRGRRRQGRLHRTHNLLPSSLLVLEATSDSLHAHRSHGMVFAANSLAFSFNTHLAVHCTCNPRAAALIISSSRQYPLPSALCPIVSHLLRQPPPDSRPDFSQPRPRVHPRPSHHRHSRTLATCIPRALHEASSHRSRGNPGHTCMPKP
ncbi:hypothetical protein LXA43DRAFT_191935 [Ganoderma leucocontextum]|nr:hypothetical protein LXA43DRAFT_191935 [Ganoderma leucocontextum]